MKRLTIYDLRLTTLKRSLVVGRWSLVLILSYVLCPMSFALPITSTNLIQNAKLYDGKIVEYQGEAIGDLMIRGNFAWLNVRDRSNAIGIFGKKELFKNIKILGDYNHRGDKIKVKGIFNRACSEHGGDLDLHAQEIILWEKGFTFHRGLSPIKVVSTLILSLIILSFYLYFSLKRYKT